MTDYRKLLPSARHATLVDELKRKIDAAGKNDIGGYVYRLANALGDFDVPGVSSTHVMAAYDAALRGLAEEATAAQERQQSKR